MSAATATTSGAPRLKANKYNRREAIAGYLFISPWIIGFLIFTLGAMIYSLVISFSHYQLATNTARPAGVSVTRFASLTSTSGGSQRLSAVARSKIGC